MAWEETRSSPHSNLSFADDGTEHLRLWQNTSNKGFHLKVFFLCPANQGRDYVSQDWGQKGLK